MATSNLGDTKTFFAVSVGSSDPVLIVDVNTDRKSVVIKNTDSTKIVYLGPSDVASTTGFPLKPGESIEDHASGDAWYAIAESGATISVRGFYVESK